MLPIRASLISLACTALLTSTASAVCSLENAEVSVDGRLSEAASDSWRWYARVGDVARCDLPGREPIDVRCQAPDCQAGERLINPPAARPIEVRAPEGWLGGPVRVEWRRFGAWGEDSELLAVRELDVEAPSESPSGSSGDASTSWPLNVARDESRLLRLWLGDSAPQTFFLPVHEEDPVPAEAPIVLEPRRLPAGGELFGFVEGDFVPERVRLHGPQKAEAEVDGYGLFATSGLPAGVYRLSAGFKGGVELSGPKVRVTAGDTAELIPWQLPASGAVEIDLGDKLCLKVSDEPASWRLQPPSGADAQLALETGCSHRFEGLRPGEWIFSLAGESTTVVIEAGEVVSAWLERVGTWVEGSVLAGGEPLGGIEVRVKTSTRRLGTEPAVPPETRTDVEGRFRLDVETTGAAIIELRSEGGFPIISRDFELVRGVNRQNFDLGEGRIEVYIERADGAELEQKATIEIWLPDGRLERTGELAAGEEGTLIYGLGYGRYQLSAFTEDGWATIERPEVELDKQQPEESALLVLDENRVVATVLGPTGQPVEGLLVAIDQRQIEPDPDYPGEYSLLGASPGSELRIVPPPNFVPVCRMLERLESFDVTLQPATAEALMVPPPAGLPAAGAFLGSLDGLPGSNCAMPVSFLWQPFVDESGRELIRLQGLTGGSFRFRNADGVVILQVPGPPVPMPGVEP